MICVSESAKILGLFPMNSYSHHGQGNVLLRELAKRGHEILLVSPIKETKDLPKGFKQIHIDKLNLDDDKNRFYDYESASVLVQAMGVNTMGLRFTEHILNNPQVQELIHSNATFDLIIMDMFLNEAFFGFAHRFNCKMVLISTLVSNLWTNHIFGHSNPPSYIPYFFLNYTSVMNFQQRFVNFISIFGEYIHRQFVVLPEQEKLLHQHFPDAPSLDNLMYNSSNLLLLNTHISTNDPAPLMPNMIEVGGYHITEPEKLTQELQEYLDSAKEGVIYFAMGSNLKSANFREHTKNALLSAFSKMKQKILWKFETPIPNLPKNVRIQKWLPQIAVLNHPNVKAFITHGGLMSTIEAVYFGIPVIGLPVFADQHMNIGIAQERGYALVVAVRDVTEENISSALHEIINNPKYKETALKLSQIMHDRQVKPLDTAVYWVEYVMRHSGAVHYQSSALKLLWFQYYSIDVIATLLSLICITIFLFFKFFMLIKRLICHISKLKSD